MDLAIKLATRAGLPGADHMIQQQYQNYINSGQYGEAAKIAANSPRGLLRTPQTIETFKKLPNVPGTLSPILQYFGILLEKGELNKYESLELARPVIQQGKKQLLEKWLKENKASGAGFLGTWSMLTLAARVQRGARRSRPDGRHEPRPFGISPCQCPQQGCCLLCRARPV